MVLRTAVTAPVAASYACVAPAEFSRFSYPLLHTVQRLASGEPLTIVAIGSSSTAGAGASSPAASYPSRLAVELKHGFPATTYRAQSRRQRRRDRADVGAVCRPTSLPRIRIWSSGRSAPIRCCATVRCDRIRSSCKTASSS